MFWFNIPFICHDNTEQINLLFNKHFHNLQQKCHFQRNARLVNENKTLRVEYPTRDSAHPISYIHIQGTPSHDAGHISADIIQPMRGVAYTCALLGEEIVMNKQEVDICTGSIYMADLSILIVTNIEL